MSDPKTPTPPAEGKQLTTAEAAKRVRRTVTELVDGKDGEGKVQRAKRVTVDADEVLAFRDHGTHVVVVTKDGQKLSSLDA